ncbi:hypothetical protein ACNQR7_26990 [Mycolicibacterium senegalense]|uniref:hypothetical protein n=1 Tax=Mycolicibacterium TaxID=1866885 RepID=UPI00320471F2
MTDQNVLDAEYRAFVRQLHEQTIAIVSEVDRYWHRELFVEVALFTSGVFDREYDEAEQKEIRDRATELQNKLQNEILPQLNILAFGHPDPDLRRAANVMGGRMQNVVFYHDAIRAKRKDGKHATTAIQLAHKGITELRKLAYHAPFRVNRPEPEYDGIGVVEPLPSQLTDVPSEEW